MQIENKEKFLEYCKKECSEFTYETIKLSIENNKRTLTLEMAYLSYNINVLFKTIFKMWL